jgi:transposase
MGRKFRTGDGPGQGWLMPADPREWLPGRHLAWSVLEQAGQMDLSAFESAYRGDGQGGRPYDPVMMCGLLLYCYCKGLRSAREIEMATFDDVGARVICGNLHPDHASVARFIRRHERAVCGLLPESVKACAREGLVSLEVVAGDGTKLKASASMTANVTAEGLEAQIAELEELIAADVAVWAAEQLACDDGDATAPAPRAGGGDGPGTGAGGGKAPKRAAQTLARRQAARGQLAARQAARSDKEQQKLEARAAELAQRVARKQAAADAALAQAQARLDKWQRRQAAAAAQGKKVFARQPIGPDRDRDVIRTRAQLAKARATAAALAPVPAPDGAAKVNTTDWASRVMPLKKGGFDQLVNAQALATERSQVILAILRHDNPADTGALHPLLAMARAVLDAAGIAGLIARAVFDAGYASDANFTADAGGTELYVALAREGVQAGRSDGRQPQSALPSWQDMAARLGTPEGRAVYKKRAATIEPVFAQLTSRLGRSLNYRGDMIGAELSLWAASHNLLKAITARMARTARQTRAARAAAVPAAA